MQKNFDPTEIRTTDLSLHGQTHYQLGYESLNFAMLQPLLY